MLKNALVHWALGRRKLSVSVGSGITSDAVVDDEGKNT